MKLKKNQAKTSEKYQDLKYSHYKEWDYDKYYLFKVYDLIKKLNKTRNFKKVLDVGCADGSFASKLKKEYGFDIYGLDISKNAVKLAVKNGINAKVHNSEKEFPFPNNHFDLIFTCEVIEHIYDTDFFISELKRVLGKNGILIITTPNLASLNNRVRLVFGKYPLFVPEFKVGGAGHVRAYTIPVLKNQLRQHGLKIIKYTSPNFIFPMTSSLIPYFLKRIAIKLGDYLPKLGSHIIIIAQKE